VNTGNRRKHLETEAIHRLTTQSAAKSVDIVNTYFSGIATSVLSKVRTMASSLSVAQPPLLLSSLDRILTSGEKLPLNGHIRVSLGVRGRN
jgi:hypothetical protein